MIRIVLATTLAFTLPATAQTDSAALPAAERLMTVMGVEAQFEQIFVISAPAMAQNAVAQLEASQTTREMMEALTKGDYARKERVKAILAEEYLAAFRAQKARMVREMAREYAIAFTAAELDELARFFGSGAGAKYVAQQPMLQEKLTKANQRIGIEVGMVATPKAITRAEAELNAGTAE